MFPRSSIVFLVEPSALHPIVVQGPPWYVPIVAALLGAIVGGLVGWCSVRWSLSHADRLARNRERQRDDRQHHRTIQFDRYERQRAAIVAFRSALHLAEPGAGALILPSSRAIDVEALRSMIDFAFEQPPSFSQDCIDALNTYNTTGEPGRDDARVQVLASAAAVQALFKTTVKDLGVPAVEDAEPFRQKYLAVDADELRRLSEPLARLVTRRPNEEE